MWKEKHLSVFVWIYYFIVFMIGISSIVIASIIVFICHPIMITKDKVYQLTNQEKPI